MASTSFILKEPKSTKRTLIYLIFRLNGKRIKFSTKQNVTPIDWSQKKQKVSSDDFHHQEINNSLIRLKDKAIELYQTLNHELKREPQVEELKFFLKKNLFQESSQILSSKEKSFFQFFENLIEIRKENKKVSKSRIQAYRNTLSLLQDFQKETNNLIAFEHFDEQFSIKFRNYLEESKNYSANTILKIFRIIRTVLNNAYAKNYAVNREYKLKDFMPEGEETFEIALSLEEVEALYKFDFSKNKRLEKTRDLFVIGCFTGLRFSDYSRLGKEHLRGKFLSVVQQKTKKKNPLPVIIPILQPVKEIFEKYNYELPKDLSNQKMNENLKDMAKETGLFNDEVTYFKTKGGKSSKITKFRYEEVVTHSARRTYCSISYKLGVPTQSIMKISGHKTEKSFLGYLKISSSDHAERTLKIWESYYSSIKQDLGKTVKMHQSA